MHENKGRAYWEAHLAAIAQEGIQTKAYAKREGLSVSALYFWRKQLKANVSPAALPVAASTGRQFMQVQISDAAPRMSCSLTVAPGVRLELTQLPSPEWLAALGAAICRQVR